MIWCYFFQQISAVPDCCHDIKAAVVPDRKDAVDTTDLVGPFRYTRYITLWETFT
jgi:hypothetical protein